MRMTGRLAVTLSCSLLLCGCATHVNPATVGPKPTPIDPPSQDAIHNAIVRGVRFLVETQNKTGSWGTIRHKEHMIYAPYPGTFIGFRAATTALCVAALIEARSDESGAAEALRRGEDWMLENLPEVRMSSPNVMYNNWAHAYALEALVLMLQKEPPDTERRLLIRKNIEEQQRRLVRYQSVDGGWGYYIYGPTIPPIGGTVTFTTATALVALHDAQEAGFPVDRKVVDRGLYSVNRSRKPDFSYGYQMRSGPMTRGSQKPGSLGRSQACNLALYLWEDDKISLDIIKTWLDRLFARNGWLSMARKQQDPHQGYYGNAGYYYYYGHYYAARSIDVLPEDERPHFQDHLAHTLLALQEKDGSWWDYMLYNFHQQYCTGYAVRSLVRCLQPPQDGPTGKETP